VDWRMRHPALADGFTLHWFCAFGACAALSPLYDLDIPARAPLLRGAPGWRAAPSLPWLHFYAMPHPQHCPATTTLHFCLPPSALLPRYTCLHLTLFLLLAGFFRHLPCLGRSIGFRRWVYIHLCGLQHMRAADITQHSASTSPPAARRCHAGMPVRRMRGGAACCSAVRMVRASF